MRLTGWKSPCELTATDSVLESTERPGRINPGRYNCQGGGSTQICPQCGRQWVLRCRPDQWGYWYQDGRSGCHKLTLFCGPACVKAWAEERDRLEAENLVRSRSYKLWRLVAVEGHSQAEAAARCGVTVSAVHTAVEWVENFRFRALDWLRKHKEAGT